MPNLDTHAHLALSHNPEGGIEFAAGEVFDDAVRMSGGTPNHDAGESIFYNGIHSNNAVTDPAFDAQPALIGAKQAMLDDLRQTDVPEVLHRTCVQIGSDILFSGVSQQRSESAAAYLEVCDFLSSATGTRLIERYSKLGKDSSVGIEQVRSNVRAIAAHGIRGEYTDPAYVLDRLRLRVANRRRLAFPTDFDQHTVLVGVFAAQQNRLAQVAGDIYCGTIAQINKNGIERVQARFNMPHLPVVPNVNSVIERASLTRAPNMISEWEDIITRELLAFNGSTEGGRKRFVASRAAAHFLLQHMARFPDEHTVSQPGQSAPEFPPGWLGSITHSDDFAAAAIASATNYKGIGIDIEAKPRHISRERILTPQEQKQPALAEIQTRTIASIKEAIYKAVHPIIAREHPGMFGFQDAEITSVDAARSRVAIRMANTEHGNRIAVLLGDMEINGYFLQSDQYSSSVCTVT